jgi:hypothetical protein
MLNAELGPNRCPIHRMGEGIKGWEPKKFAKVVDISLQNML